VLRGRDQKKKKKQTPRERDAPRSRASAVGSQGSLSVVAGRGLTVPAITRLNNTQALEYDRRGVEHANDEALMLVGGLAFRSSAACWDGESFQQQLALVASAHRRARRRRDRRVERRLECSSHHERQA